MRLTLRTLLAYLDDILDEQESQELQKKIDDSEVATRLVHQIRQLVGQTRFDVPDVDAQGIGADANSVAEYLDSTLSPEQFPEFERVCLDSDTHLSEVAACHQILTLVLGEPAEVTPELKAKIYRLSGAVSAGFDANDVISSGTEPVTETMGAATRDTVQRVRDEDEHWTEAPDYLKRPRRSIWKPVGIAALIAFCFALAGLAGMGSLDRTHPLAKLFLGEEQATDGEGDFTDQGSSTPTSDQSQRASSTPAGDQASPNAAPSTPAVMPTDEQPTDGAPTDGVPSNETDGSRDRFDEDLLDSSTDDDQAFDPADGVELDSSTSDTDSPSVQEPAPQSVQDPAEVHFDTAERDGTPLDGNVPPIPTSQPGDAQGLTHVPSGDTRANAHPAADDDLATAPDNNSLDSAATPLGNPGEPTDGTATNEAPTIISVLPTSPDTPDTSEADSGADPEETASVARFLSEGQLLVRYNPVSELWETVEVREPLGVDDRLLSFPIFRPQIMLATGMQVTMIGPAQARLLGSIESPRVELEFGRVNVETFTQTGTSIGLTWGAASADAELADMNSAFSLDVSRVHAPGVDPEKNDPHTLVRVFVTSGQIEWRAAGSEPVTLSPGQQMTILDQGAPQISETEELPEWIDGRDSRPRDPFAMRGLLPHITVARPVSLALREQAESKREEVRSLAVCSLAYLGEFDPLLVALNDDRLRSYWSQQYETLLIITSLRRETAKLVHDAILSRHSEDGDQLFRMLWGFSPDQLAEDGARLLVDMLDHPSSDFRIAAIENLKTITGTPSLYMPHYTEKLRRPSIFKWRDKLKKGQIVYRETPDVLRLLSAETVAP